MFSVLVLFVFIILYNIPTTQHQHNINIPRLFPQKIFMRVTNLVVAS